MEELNPYELEREKKEKARKHRILMKRLKKRRERRK